MKPGIWISTLALLFSFAALADHSYEAVDTRAHELRDEIAEFQMYSLAVPQGPFFTRLNAELRHADGHAANLLDEVHRPHPRHYVVRGECRDLTDSLNQWRSIYAEGEEILRKEKKPQYHNVYRAGLNLKPVIRSIIEACRDI